MMAFWYGRGEEGLDICTDTRRGYQEGGDAMEGMMGRRSFIVERVERLLQHCCGADDAEL